MPSRQLIFLGMVGLLSLLAAVSTGPMVIEALLGPLEGTEPPMESAPPPASGAEPHPAAQP